MYRGGLSDLLEVLLAGAISPEDVNACVSVLDEGGALTNVQTAADELPHCLFVAVMRDENRQVIGVGAIKDQRPEYAARIASEMKSGYEFDPHMHEFGYVVVKESHQGKGHSAQITEKLLSLLPGKPLFATTSNPRMLATLKKYGFTQKGKTWKSSKGKELSLWIKD
jgi:RimJ/RimL family protein N-acetyltransferase